MNGTNNAKNNSGTKIVTNTSPAQPPLSTVNVQKVSSNASTPVNTSSTRHTNGDVSSSTTSKGKKSAPPTMDPSEMHEMLQNRIAALEGEKVQGGEDDKRSGRSSVCWLTAA